MRTWTRIVIVAAVAVAALVLLFPFSGTFDQPQKHESVLGNRVPTDSPMLAVGGAIVLGGVAWVVTGRKRA